MRSFIIGLLAGAALAVAAMYGFYWWDERGKWR